MSLRANSHMLRKLLVVAAGMFAFGYALVPLYQTICEVTGINILALGEREMPGTICHGRRIEIPIAFGCPRSCCSKLR